RRDASRLRQYRQLFPALVTAAQRAHWADQTEAVLGQDGAREFGLLARYATEVRKRREVFYEAEIVPARRRAGRQRLHYQGRGCYEAGQDRLCRKLRPVSFEQTPARWSK